MATNWFSDDYEDEALWPQAALPAATAPAVRRQSRNPLSLADLYDQSSAEEAAPEDLEADPWAAAPPSTAGLAQAPAMGLDSLTPKTFAQTKPRVVSWEQARKDAEAYEASKPKPEQPIFGLSDFASAAGGFISALPTTGTEAFYRMKEGSKRPDQFSPEAQAAFAESRALQERMTQEQAEREKAGTSTTVGQAIREATSSSGYTLGSMGPAIAGGLAGAKVGTLAGGPVGGVVGGIVGGFGGSGAAAFTMSQNQFMEDAFREAEARMQKTQKRSLNEQEKQALYQEMEPLARDNALWEAGPEAVGNAFMLVGGGIAAGLLGKQGISKLAGGALRKGMIRTGALATGVGMEFATETATELGQALPRARMEAYLEGKPMEDAVSRYAGKPLGGAGEAFEEIWRPTLGTVLMFGLGGAAVKGASKANERFRQNPQEADAIVEMTNDPNVLAAMPQQSLENLQELSGFLRDQWFAGSKRQENMSEAIAKISAELQQRTNEDATTKRIRRETLGDLWTRMAPQEQSKVLEFFGATSPGVTGWTTKEGAPTGQIDARGLNRLANVLGVDGKKFWERVEQDLRQREFDTPAPERAGQDVYDDFGQPIIEPASDAAPGLNQVPPTQAPPAQDQDIPLPPSSPAAGPTVTAADIEPDTVDVAGQPTVTVTSGMKAGLAQLRQRAAEAAGAPAPTPPPAPAAPASGDLARQILSAKDQDVLAQYGSLTPEAYNAYPEDVQGAIRARIRALPENQRPAAHPALVAPTAAPITPTPGETVQLQRGQEVILTPPAPGAAIPRSTATPEDQAAIREKLGERSRKPKTPPTPTEVIPDAQEVQRQAEAETEVIPDAQAIPVDEAPVPEAGTPREGVVEPGGGDIRQPGQDQESPQPAGEVAQKRVSANNKIYQNKGGTIVVFDNEATQRRNLEIDVSDKSAMAGMGAKYSNLMRIALKRDAQNSFDKDGNFIGKGFSVVTERGKYLFNTLEEAKKFAETTGMRKGKTRKLISQESQPAGEVAQGEVAPILESYTPEQLREREEAQVRADAERRRAEQEADAKAKADEAAKDFRLTGSDSARDQAAARGQMGLGEEASAPQTTLSGLAAQEIPLSDITLSEDVPQFKSDADPKTGVVTPLGGKFTRMGTAPVILWERLNGKKELISGRHRLALARESGEQTIPAQILREADGFDVRQAQILDAELNIRDEQGKVKDYVQYFEGSQIPREEAERRGLLARPMGQRAYEIATQGSQDLIAAHRADQLKDDAAYRIATTAPNDDRLQAVGLKAVQDGKSADNAVNMMRAVQVMLASRQAPVDSTADMFGFDPTAIQEAERMAKAATAEQNRIQKLISASSGAARDTKSAEKVGVTVTDPEATKKTLAQLRAEKSAWDNWSTNPELVAKLRDTLEGKPAETGEPIAAPVSEGRDLELDGKPKNTASVKMNQLYGKDWRQQYELDQRGKKWFAVKKPDVAPGPREGQEDGGKPAEPEVAPEPRAEVAPGEEAKAPVDESLNASRLNKRIKDAGIKPNSVTKEAYADDGRIIVVRYDEKGDPAIIQANIKKIHEIVQDIAPAFDANAIVLRRNKNLVFVVPAHRGIKDKSTLTPGILRPEFLPTTAEVKPEPAPQPEAQKPKEPEAEAKPEVSRIPSAEASLLKLAGYTPEAIEAMSAAERAEAITASNAAVDGITVVTPATLGTQAIPRYVVASGETNAMFGLYDRHRGNFTHLTNLSTNLDVALQKAKVYAAARGETQIYDYGSGNLREIQRAAREQDRGGIDRALYGEKGPPVEGAANPEGRVEPSANALSVDLSLLDDDALLRHFGLDLQERVAKSGKTYWAITGTTERHKAMLDALGFKDPIKMDGVYWRSVFKENPKAKLVEALRAGGEVRIEPRPTLPRAEAEQVLTQAGLVVTQNPNNPNRWTVEKHPQFKIRGGNNPLWTYKVLMQDLGGVFNRSSTKRNVIFRVFDYDPTEALGYAIANADASGSVAGDAQAPGRGGNVQDDPRIRELRQRLDARDDRRLGAGEYRGRVSDDTQRLITEGGDRFHVPKQVQQEQIEDIGMIVRAFEEDAPAFILANAAGTGKTMVMGGAIRELRRLGHKKFVYVTQSRDLIEQIKTDLAAYGVDDVMFHTYAEMSGDTRMDVAGAVIFFDEAHNIKNINDNTARAIRGQQLIALAKMSVFASATPFENPTQAQYLGATGLFTQEQAGEVSGFPFVDWAAAFGAEIETFEYKDRSTGKKVTRYLPKWRSSEASKADAKASREWLAKQGILTQRPMRINPNMVDVEFSRTEVAPYFENLYNEVDDVYDDALIALESGEMDMAQTMDGKVLSDIAMHRENTIKRILEASKVPAAIQETRKLLDAGQNVVIFVETKADRTLNRWRKSEGYQKEYGKDDKLYAYPEMKALMDAWQLELDAWVRTPEELRGTYPKPPFADFIYHLAGFFHQQYGDKAIELPSTAAEIVKAFGKDNVGIYTGPVSATADMKAVTTASANKAKEKFLAGELKILVATMAKGGTGLSLHDKVGNRPTTQLNINLPWTATQVEQVMARVARYGLQSKALVRWMFASNIGWESDKLAPKVGARMRDMGATVQGIDVPAAEILASDFDFTGTREIAKRQAAEEPGRMQEAMREAEDLGVVPPAQPDADQRRYSRADDTITEVGMTQAQARAEAVEALGDTNVRHLERNGFAVWLEPKPGARPLPGNNRTYLSSTGQEIIAPADAQAFVQNGVVHLIPSNMRTGALNALLHESAHLMKDERYAEGDRTILRMSHAVLNLAGLRNFIGNPGFQDLAEQVQRMAREGNSVALKALAQAQQVDPNRIAEESVAYLVEYGDMRLPIVRRILAAIRAALYRMGVKMELRPEDVRQLAVSALKARAQRNKVERRKIVRLAELERLYEDKYGDLALGELRVEVLRRMEEDTTLEQFRDLVTQMLERRYSYAGPRAATADLGALQQAKLRVENGEDADADIIVNADRQRLSRAPVIEVSEATMEEFEAIRAQFQARQAETPFRQWFGKGTPGVTATADGTPITLYHGTNNPLFAEWDSSRAAEASGHPTSGLGFFMTADKRAAARYGNNLLELHAKIDKPYYLTNADLTGIETRQDAERLRWSLMKQGYDGAVVEAPGAAPYVIAFKPNQVKFTTNEKPTASPDMRYSRPPVPGQPPTPADAQQFLNDIGGMDMEPQPNILRRLWNDPSAWRQTLKSSVADAVSNTRPAWTRLLSRQQIVEMLQESPIARLAKHFEDTARLLDADKTEGKHLAFDIAKRLREAAAKSRDKGRGLYKLWFFTTLESVDPTQPAPQRDNYGDTADYLRARQAHTRAVEMLNELRKANPVLADLYKEVIVENKRSFEAYHQALKDRLGRGANGIFNAMMDRAKDMDPTATPTTLTQRLAKLAEDPAAYDAFTATVRERLQQPDMKKDDAAALRDTLPDDAQKALFDDLVADVRGKIKSSVDALQSVYEQARVLEPYFPLSRWGDYQVYAEKAGEPKPVFAAFAREQDQRAAIAQLQKEGWTVKVNYDTAGKLTFKPPADSFLGKMFVMVDEILSPGKDATQQEKSVLKKQSDALKDEFYQMYLRSLPDLSSRKHSLHRKGIPGFSMDALRGFAQLANSRANAIARLKHSDILSEALTDMERALKRAGLDPSRVSEINRAGALLGELQGSYEWMMNPTNATWANRLTSFGFLWHLTNISTALVNGTQIAIASFPDLAAKFGGGSAFSAISKAIKDYGAWKFKHGDARLRAEKSLYDEYEGDMERMLKSPKISSQISRTEAVALAGMSDDAPEFSGGVKGSVAALYRGALYYGGWLYNKVEVANREITVIAAYRLARRKADAEGKTREQAHDYATEVAYNSMTRTQGDFSLANRAWFMRGNAMRVMFLFRSFSHMMTFNILRDAYQSVKGKDAESRKLARDRLVWTGAASLVFAGATGFPMYTIVSILANAMFGSDPDDPWDFDSAVRDELTAYGGDTLMRTVMQGPLGQAPRALNLLGLDVKGIDLAPRVSLDLIRLWIRRQPEDSEGGAGMDWWMGQVAGPLYGTARGVAEGLRMLGQTSHDPQAWWRTLESLTPAPIRNLAKAARFEEHGVTTRRGDLLMDDVGFTDLISQAIGFTPDELAEQYRTNTRLWELKTLIDKRRRNIYSLYIFSVEQGDEAMQKTAMERVERWNELNPEYPITFDGLRGAYKKFMRARALQEGGVFIPSKGLKARVFRDLTADED